MFKTVGSGVAKELIHMTHGHELSGGNCWREGGIPCIDGQKGVIWDNYNNIINKTFF